MALHDTIQVQQHGEGEDRWVSITTEAMLLEPEKAREYACHLIRISYAAEGDLQELRRVETHEAT